MNKKSICSIIAALLIPLMATMILPASAWSYGDPAKADDLLYEKFGPRCDRLLIKLYTSETAEWDTGLETGQIDATDWPLDTTHYNRYTAPPWNDTVSVLGYGPEFGCYLFDLNNNNNQYLGNPPNPAYPNPVYPNPMSDVDLRKAVAYLSNRTKYVAFIGATIVTPLYTPVGPSSGKYSHPDIKPGGVREDLCYLCDPAAANDTLEAGGFPLNLVTGWRYWDRDSDLVEDPGEAFNLKVVANMGSAGTLFAGTSLSTNLTSCRVPNTLMPMSDGAARTQVMWNKNFHIYTGGWSLTVDPDFLIFWNWDFYWHPGQCCNYCGCNDPVFNTASYGVMYANDQLEAVDFAHAAQLAFATNVLSVPLWVATGFKAVKRTYTGTPGVPDSEDQFEGKYWNGIVNRPGHGVDSYDTFNNMYPEGCEYGNGTGPTGTNLTIRYGFKTQEIKTMNAIYAERLWDNTVLGLIGYEGLLARNSYNLGQFEPWVAYKYSVGTYLHPVYGTCTKVVFTLRPGVQWSDGKPVTIADIFFTFVEMKQILDSRSLPPPWWYSNVMNILSFSILDPLHFEVLLDVKSVFAVGWIGGNRIMPKHIWKPICTAGDPTTFAPDPNLIGSGPWRLVEYVENSHVLFYANTPATTTDNNLPGSIPITSDLGYYRWYPIIPEISLTPDLYKFDKAAYQWFWENVTFTNLWASDTTFNYTLSAELRFVNGTIIHMPNQTETNVPIIGFGTYLIGYNHTSLHGLWRYHIDIWVKYICPNGITSIWHWHWCCGRLWCTIKEDIAGSTWYDDVGLGDYPYKFELLSADFKVDIKDVARESRAFGSYAGHPKWNAVADINGDYKVDIKDLARVSAKYGWHA